ncbi:alpha/beta fold hydrolase [Lacticaseibacillus baoqingensis]|uniref:Alpha/beta fold hydrolase n=1 Tax=Lacticaseibacillus baoqingensis TaxID=2486013 RepID=A0ABW4E9U8_9LACO|nr:alpha/beta hydrolase [Lacticaseibacillus baoqingensis]
MEITVNQIRLFYTQTGHGQPLLLLHGNGEDHSLFTDMIPKLARDYTVYALDSRDHGQSQHGLPLSYQLMADDVMAFADALHLHDLNLVGFSDGAVVTMLVASQRPAQVHKIVLAGGNLTPEGVKFTSRIGVKLANWRHPDPKLALMLNEPHIDITTLSRISAQAFVIAGAKDVIKKEETVAIASGIPTSILRIVPNATHSSYVKDNEQFYHYIAAFLQPYRTE